VRLHRPIPEPSLDLMASLDCLAQTLAAVRSSCVASILVKPHEAKVS